MTFFYNLNKKLDEIRATPETTHKQLNERDEGKPGKNFAKISADAAKRYGSKEAGDRVAGAVRAKLAKQGKLEENAAAGYDPETQARIKAATPQQLAQMAQEFAGGPAQYQSELKMLQQAKAELSGQMQEGFLDSVKGAAQKALDVLGHPDDEEMIKDLQRKAGVPQTGKVPMATPNRPGQTTAGQPATGQPTTAGQKPMAEADMEEGVMDWAKEKYHDYQTGRQWSKHAKAQRKGDAAGMQAAQDAANMHKDKLQVARLNRTGTTLAKNSDYGMDQDRANIAALQKKGMVPKNYGSVAEEGGEPMTAKQKSFAALAEPRDKITFADKIAGAKKEVDEMLGDVAAEAMKNALRGGQKKLDKNKNGKLDAMDFEILRKGGKQTTDEGWDDMEKDVKSRMGQMKTGEKKKTSKGEVEKTSTGLRHTRSYDAKTGETDTGDDEKATGEKRGRGRPKKDKAPERVTGKAYKHKGGRKTNEDSSHGQAQQIYNDLADIRAVAKQVQTGQGQFPQGFASRLESTLWAAMTLLKNQQPANAQVREQDLDEKAVSKAQQRFMGMAHAMQKGEKIPGASKELKKVAKTMKKGDVEDFAKTKHEGLPEKKKKEKTEETTVAGSVAPAEGGKAKKGGSVIGKGIYDSLNRDLEAMIAESMNVSVNMTMDEHGEPHKNITVSAEGEAAEQLAQLLNLAGMQAQGGDEDCGCGTTPCSCNDEMVDENAPDWPTEPETTGGDDPHLTRWAGGLNKPKETGQTTIPVVNRDPARGSVGPLEMAEAKDLGMKLYAELKSFKA